VKIQTILIGIISFIVGYFLIGQNLEAKWFYVDDHEIPNFLQGKNRLALTDIPVALRETEFYSFGKGARFRPVYSLFRVTETFLWGTNPTVWYMARFIMFVCSFAILWIILRNYTGYILGFLILMYTMTFPYWKDIWARMGPGEIYCVPAFSLFLWSFIKLLEGKKDVIYWIALTISSVIAIGSKETFAFLLILIIFLNCVLIYRKQINRQAIIFSFLILGYISYILMGVGLYMYGTGNDFYLNSVDTQSRILNLATTLSNTFMRVWKKVYPYKLIGIGIVSFFSLFWVYLQIKKAKKTEKSLYGKALWQLVWTLGLTGIMVASQIYFYNGTWPTRMRYDFPGLLAIPISMTAFYLFLRTLFLTDKKLLFYHLLPYFFGILLLGGILKIGYGQLILASDINVTRTIEFTTRLETIKKDVSMLNKAPILYESCNPGDYEFITSLNRFLYKELHTHTIFLMTDYTAYTFTSALDTHLGESLVATSKNGNDIFRPLEEKKTDTDCYSINFSCPEMHCSQGMSLVQPWCISRSNPRYTSPYRTKVPNSDCVL